MTSIQIHIPSDAIFSFCEKWKVTEFALFGSVVREDFGPNSDIDVLLTFQETTTWSLLDISAMQLDLEAIFGRRVDILTRRGVERSRNPYRKKAILESAQIIHAA